MPSVCPSCRLPLPADAPQIRFCPSCGCNLATGQAAVGWVRQGIDLRMVARRQRMLLWFVLVVLVMQFSPLLLRGIPGGGAPLLEGALGLVALTVIIAILIGVLQLMTAMGTGLVARILCGVLMFAPCANLLLLLIINNRATNMLQLAGLRVGLLGASDEQLTRVLGANTCKKCGYNLIGNTTGICSECGTPTAAAPPTVPPGPPPMR